MITNIEDYFSKGCGRCARFDTADCSTRQWASGLADLRRICRASILTETVKWGHPCYTHKDCNIAIIGAFRNDFRLTFFNAALMKDPKHILQKQGPNTKHAGMFCFTSNAEVALLEPTILSYLKEAKTYAETGQKPPKEKSELEPPKN